MKKLPAICCLILIGLLGSTAKAEIVLYCQSELAAGFIKKNGRWQEGNFNLERFTIKFNDNFSRVEGLTSEPMECSVSFNHKPNLIFCVHSWGSHETLIYEKKKSIVCFTGDSSVYWRNNNGRSSKSTPSENTRKRERY